jgi:hypothetical protein
MYSVFATNSTSNVTSIDNITIKIGNGKNPLSPKGEASEKVLMDAMNSNYELEISAKEDCSAQAPDFIHQDTSRVLT